MPPTKKNWHSCPEECLGELEIETGHNIFSQMGDVTARNTFCPPSFFSYQQVHQFVTAKVYQVPGSPLLSGTPQLAMYKTWKLPKFGY